LTTNNLYEVRIHYLESSEKMYRVGGAKILNVSQGKKSSSLPNYVFEYRYFTTDKTICYRTRDHLYNIIVFHMYMTTTDYPVIIIT